MKSEVSMHILVLHGVNLNMFGKRDPSQYGTATLADIDTALQALAHDLKATAECFQTNHGRRGHYRRGGQHRGRHGL